jgi:hypothetical protein
MQPEFQVWENGRSGGRCRVRNVKPSNSAIKRCAGIGQNTSGPESLFVQESRFVQ